MVSVCDLLCLSHDAREKHGNTERPSPRQRGEVTQAATAVGLLALQTWPEHARFHGSVAAFAVDRSGQGTEGAAQPGKHAFPKKQDRPQRGPLALPRLSVGRAGK